MNSRSNSQAIPRLLLGTYPRTLLWPNTGGGSGIGSNTNSTGIQSRSTTSFLHLTPSDIATFSSCVHISRTMFLPETNYTVNPPSTVIT